VRARESKTWMKKSLFPGNINQFLNYKLDKLLAIINMPLILIV